MSGPGCFSHEAQLPMALTALLSILEPFGFQPSGSRQGGLRIQGAHVGRAVPACPLIVIVALLAGCATVPTGPAPIATSTKTVTANVAVAVPCILPEDIPKVPVAMELPEDATTLQKVALLASYAKDLQRYVDIADSLIQICAKVTP